LRLLAWRVARDNRNCCGERGKPSNAVSREHAQIRRFLFVLRPPKDLNEQASQTRTARVARQS
jgi:hypothetical protein